MSIFSSFFKSIDTTGSVNEHSVAKKELLEEHFTFSGTGYRNHDGSVPELSNFLSLGLSVDDYVFFVHGKTQLDLQKRLQFKHHAKRTSKKQTMEKRLHIKAQSSRNKSSRIDGLQNEFFAFGMLAPFGVYLAANTFGLHTLRLYNLATSEPMASVFNSMGNVDPSITTFDETAIGTINDAISSGADEFSSNSHDLF